jgi:hypothetical protein
MELETVLNLLKELQKNKVQYCLIGGVAMNFHGLPRATMDIDMFVSSQEDNIKRLKDALQTVFHDPDIEQISAQDLAGNYPAIQYSPPEGTFHIDILSRLGSMLSFEDIEKETIDVEGVPVTIATAKMLYQMKKGTVRLRDKADAERLRQHFHLKE